jgi:hypothetical protein
MQCVGSNITPIEMAPLESAMNAGSRALERKLSDLVNAAYASRRKRWLSCGAPPRSACRSTPRRSCAAWVQRQR